MSPTHASRSNPRCPSCRAPMTRWGHYATKNGPRRRWRCTACGATCGRRLDERARTLASFIRAVTGDTHMDDLPGAGHQARRRWAPCREYWPLPPAIDQPSHIIHVDGPWFHRNAVLLIAACPTHLLG